MHDSPSVGINVAASSSSCQLINCNPQYNECVIVVLMSKKIIFDWKIEDRLKRISVYDNPLN